MSLHAHETISALHHPFQDRHALLFHIDAPIHRGCALEQIGEVPTHVRAGTLIEGRIEILRIGMAIAPLRGVVPHPCQECLVSHNRLEGAQDHSWAGVAVRAVTAAVAVFPGVGCNRIHVRCGEIAVAI